MTPSTPASTMPEQLRDQLLGALSNSPDLTTLPAGLRVGAALVALADERLDHDDLARMLREHRLSTQELRELAAADQHTWSVVITHLVNSGEHPKLVDELLASRRAGAGAVLLQRAAWSLMSLPADQRQAAQTPQLRALADLRLQAAVVTTCAATDDASSWMSYLAVCVRVFERDALRPLANALWSAATSGDIPADHYAPVVLATPLDAFDDDQVIGLREGLPTHLAAHPDLTDEQREVAVLDAMEAVCGPWGMAAESWSALLEIRDHLTDEQASALAGEVAARGFDRLDSASTASALRERYLAPADLVPSRQRMAGDAPDQVASYVRRRLPRPEDLGAAAARDDATPELLLSLLTTPDLDREAAAPLLARLIAHRGLQLDGISARKVAKVIGALDRLSGPHPDLAALTDAQLAKLWTLLLAPGHRAHHQRAVRLLDACGRDHPAGWAALTLPQLCELATVHPPAARWLAGQLTAMDARELDTFEAMSGDWAGSTGQLLEVVATL